MTCEKVQERFPDMLLDSAPVADRVPIEVRRHLDECPRCKAEWDELQATMRLLDAWEAPSPSGYFDTRMAARLREEKNAQAAGWMERVRTRLLFGSNLRLRPVMAAAIALLIAVGAGSYEGFVHLSNFQSSQPAVSATVKDLELLDSNAQALQQLAAFDTTDAAIGQGSGNDASN